MKTKIITLSIICSTILTSFSFAQSSDGYSSIPSIVSSQKNEGSTGIKVPQEVSIDIDFSNYNNYGYWCFVTPQPHIKVKVGEEFVINAVNPDNKYRSDDFQASKDFLIYRWPGLYGDIEHYNSFIDNENIFYTHLVNSTWTSFCFSGLCIEKEYHLNQETGNPLVYHFKAIRPGTVYIQFGHKRFVKTRDAGLDTGLDPGTHWEEELFGPRVIVEVSK